MKCDSLTLWATRDKKNEITVFGAQPIFCEKLDGYISHLGNFILSKKNRQFWAKINERFEEVDELGHKQVVEVQLFLAVVK